MQSVCLNARDFQGRAKVEAFQDAVAAICKLEFHPEDLARFASRTEIHVLPGLITARGQHSRSTAIRTGLLADAGDDNVMFHIPRSGGYSMQQAGGEAVDCVPGVVYVDANKIAGKVQFEAGLTDGFYVSIPSAMLAPVRAALGKAMCRGHALTPEWRMFLRYAEALHEEAAGLSPEHLARCADHVRDLAAMALGAGGEAAEIAAGRGIRAARLRDIKADIEQNLQSPELRAGWIAGRHGISERYLRGLFAAQETTFGDHVALRRLVLARKMLQDPASAHLTIAEIAMSCGFGDLSWFNALFRRHFGRTPSSFRAER